MFLMNVKPWKSSKWELPAGETIASTDRRASEAYASRRPSGATRGYSNAGRIEPQAYGQKEETNGGSQHIS